MTGLKIRTVTGAEFEVHGAVEYNTATGIYYCNGESWPESIVMEVLGVSNTEISAKVKEYREIQQFIKQLEDEAEAIKAAITAEMEAQNVDTLHTDIFTVKWTAYKANRLDTTALKQELPEIAARYTKITKARRFQVA